ncbi:hypothetical protein [Streptomyces omiyaensis]|uniref:Uncharacterized protein n=1 Tax=Streptomyces omiyaensis TaxID=68247 RepID=A0ABW7BXU1_9ACTN
MAARKDPHGLLHDRLRRLHHPRPPGHRGGTALYQGIRLADGSWTGFADVQAQACDIGGTRAAAVAGIGGDTHVLAITAADDTLRHTVRKADGSLTRVTAAAIDTDLHVVAVADGKVFHTLRNADGHWTPFGDLSAVAGPLGTVTRAAIASVGGALQVVTVSGGKAHHTLRTPSGHWTAWGDVTRAAGPTGPVTGVAIAGVADDAHVVVATDNGTRQYHSVRRADAGWEPFGELTGHLGGGTVRSLSAARVDGELQLAAVTADGKVVHTVRHADRTWTTAPVLLPGVPGPLGTLSLTGTL